MLAWDAYPSAVNYYLFFDDNPTPVIVGDHTTFDVHHNTAVGMVPGSTHTFQVRAEDRSGHQSAFSNKLTVSFAPGDATPPTAPSNLHVVSNDSSGIELTWDPSTDESDFTYHVSQTTCSPLVVTSDTTHVLIPSIDTDPVCGLQAGSTYSFDVWARDALDNDSAHSNTVTVTFNG